MRSSSTDLSKAGKLTRLLARMEHAESAVRLALQDSQRALSRSELAVHTGLPLGAIQSALLGFLAAGSVAAEPHYRYRWVGGNYEQ